MPDIEDRKYGLLFSAEYKQAALGLAIRDLNCNGFISPPMSGFSQSVVMICNAAQLHLGLSSVYPPNSCTNYLDSFWSKGVYRVDCNFLD